MMPQDYPCDVCRATTADFMITQIGTGDVIAVGVECILDWAMPIAEAFMAAGQAEDQAIEAGQAAAESPDPEWEADYPQGRKSKGKAAPTEGDQEQPEVSTAGATADVNE